MKKVLLIAFAALFFNFNASAQDEFKLPIDSGTNLITFTDVVRVDSVSKNELYTRAREWFAKSYRSANDVIQMDDREAGKIVGKGLSFDYITAIGIPNKYKLFYTITVTCRDGRYKYELSDYEVQFYPDRYIPNPMRGAVENVFRPEVAYNKKKQLRSIPRQHQANLLKHSEGVIADLKTAMGKKVSVANSDW